MPVSKKRKRTPEQIIAGAKRAERTITVCLRADLSYQIEDLEAQLTELQEQAGDDSRMGGVSDQERQIAEAIHELELEADENSIELKVRAVPNHVWRAAMAGNPSNPTDLAAGWAIDRDETCREILADSVVEPEIEPTVLNEMVDGLAQGQWALIRDAILLVNGGDGSRPFSRHASLIRRLSDNAADSPDLTASVLNGSTDGNPAPSSRSRTGVTDKRLGG